MSTVFPAGAIVAAKRRRLINTFKEAGATSPQSAILPEDYAIRKGFIFRRLCNFDVLIEANEGRYYLDEAAEKELSKQRRIILLVVLTCFLAVIVAVLMIRR